MKKLGILLLILPIFLCSSIVNAAKYELNNNEILAVDKVFDIYARKIDVKGLEYKDKLTNNLRYTINRLETGSRNYEVLFALTTKLENYGLNDNNEVINNNTETPGIDNNNEDNDNVIISGGDIVKSHEETFEKYRVNLPKVKEIWVEWQNEVRKELGLENYNYSYKLEETATEWSENMAKKSEADHKRDAGDAYYNYNKISNWMKDRGVICKNNNGYTFSESVARTSYYCSETSTDCTDAFIEGLRKSFDRYMAEKDKNENSRPHYNAIVSPNFKIQGMGIGVKEKSATNFEVYITTHYCTELTE